MRLPNDDEINAAARELGCADDNGVCPPSLRSRVAKTLRDAVVEEAQQVARADGIATVVADIADVHHRLVDAVGAKAATAIAAAIAPVIYQSAHPERTDNAAPRLDKPR